MDHKSASGDRTLQGSSKPKKSARGKPKKVWVPRGVKNASLVARQALLVQQEAAGAMDALQEVKEEIVNLLEEKQLPKPDVTTLDQIVVPEKPNSEEKKEEEDRWWIDDLTVEEERDDMSRLKDALKHHYVVAGHDSKAIRTANAKLPSWFNVLGVPKETKLEDALVVNRDVYLENWNPFNTWSFWWRDIRNRYILPLAPFLLYACYAIAVISWMILMGPKKQYAMAALVVNYIWYRYVKPTASNFVITRVESFTDWCSGHWSPFKANNGNWIKLPNWLTQNMKCVEKSYWVGFTARGEGLWYPRMCFHNMLKALGKRQLLTPLSTPVIRKLRWDYCLGAFSELFPFTYVAGEETPELRKAFLDRYPKGRRQMLERAWQTTQDGYHYLSAATKAFVKGEWNLAKAIEKMDPRCISGKLDEYLMTTAPLYWDMVKFYCKNVWPNIDTIISSKTKFVYAGALSATQLGELVSHFESLGWYAYEGDYSRYDGRNEKEALEAEFAWYKLPQALVEALKLQLETRGSGAGLTFGHVGKVASGVINTSFGNTIRGFMLIAGWCKSQGITDYLVLQLGDDNVLFFKKPIELCKLVEWCEEAGHKLEIVPRPDYDLLEFCSGRFWNIGERRVLGFKIGRIFVKTFLASKSAIALDQMGSYVTQIAEGFKNFYWTPVLGTFCQRIIGAKLVGRRVKLPTNDYKLKLDCELDVDPLTVNLQFEKIYGFNASQLEADLRTWKPEIGTELYHPLLEKIVEVDC